MGLLILAFCSCSAAAQAKFDVLHYDISIEPDIQSKSVKGSVTIRFVANVDHLDSVEFNCGSLTIDSVTQNKTVRQFSVKDSRVTITLPALKNRQTTEVEISYHGPPKYGFSFFPNESQAYSVFSTSQWTVCVDAPEDKASLTLKLITPAKLTAIGNGRLASQHAIGNDKNESVWEQRAPIPTYVFGFAIGPYRRLIEKKNGIEFQYLVTDFSEDETRRIFRDTPDMLAFYEERAGVKYADKTYAQVLATGNVAQEMSSFTAIHQTYGHAVLKDEQDEWLGAHEFAHQWWGNMVTCRDWNHFWLNEGIASFMAAAYLEHRFGRAAYMKEIDSYRESYEKIRAAGKDKSLVFPNWDHPSREDRSLVYDKGAYVMHLLRDEMGERAFWNGLRNFTRKYWGKSVVTADFEAVMQEASEKSLKEFFGKWVYLK
ncbi:MAG TPA: M1 family metallopeptidase [Pyrinomonadaceae bacterium]